MLDTRGHKLTNLGFLDLDEKIIRLKLTNSDRFVAVALMCCRDGKTIFESCKTDFFSVKRLSRAQVDKFDSNLELLGQFN